MGKSRWVSPVVVAAIVVFALSGCLGQQGIEQNRRLIAQQQALLEKQQKQIAELQARASAGPQYAPVKACEVSVRQTATRRGSEKFAAHDYTTALGYFQDALAACSSSAQAEFDVARAFEALGERGQARDHYRKAAELAGTENLAIGEQARTALKRLGR